MRLSLVEFPSLAFKSLEISGVLGRRGSLAIAPKLLTHDELIEWNVIFAYNCFTNIPSPNQSLLS